MSRIKTPLPRYSLAKIEDAVMDLGKAIAELEQLRQGKRVLIADIKLTGADCIILVERAISKLKEAQNEARQNSQNGQHKQTVDNEKAQG